MAISSDGNTAIVGGPGDSTEIGAAFAFTRSDNTWTEFGTHMVFGHDAAGHQGSALAIQANGASAMVGASGDLNGLGRATVQRYLAAFRAGGLDGLRHCGNTGPVSDLASFADIIKNDLNSSPVRTTAEACDRIEALTGIRRGLTQTRTFLAGLGFTWQRVRAVPVPPKSR